MRLLQLHKCLSAILERKSSMQLCHASCKQIVTAEAATVDSSAARL
jgi:hypothetical protein